MAYTKNKKKNKNINFINYIILKDLQISSDLEY